MSKRSAARFREFVRPHKMNRVPLILLTIFMAGTFTLMCGWSSSSGYRLWIALVWAYGFCVAGMLLGFLFAIPRILPSDGAAPPDMEDEGRSHENDAPLRAGVVRSSGGTTTTSVRTVPIYAGSYSTAGSSEINSNLVEVSDWLTKIIVGVGLVHLTTLPSRAQSVAEFIAPSLGLPTIVAIPLAGGIMLFYSVLGFLIGYLLTRIYLSVIIKWADTQVMTQNIRLESGTEIPMDTLARLQQTQMNDLQQTVAQVVSQMPEGSTVLTESGDKAYPAAVRRLLWVDDVPDNNTLYVEQLTRAGIVVDQARTTNAALDLIAQKKYDAVISDMTRHEDGKKIPDAGIVLARLVRQVHPDIPFIIFCGSRNAANNGAAAKAAGVRLVTSSGTRLIAALEKLLSEGPKGD